MKSLLAAAVSVAGFLAVALPVRADDAGDTAALQAKVRAALRSAKTFVETVKIKPNSQVPGGGTIVYTVVAPDRFRQKTSGPEPGGDDTIIVGHEVYGSKGVGSPWEVQTWSNELVIGFESDVFNPEVISLEADATGGLGSFKRHDPNGFQKDATLTCTYEKASFRPEACSNDMYDISYSNYDDPSVEVPVPLRSKRVDR
ncbi:MAG: hypothetical protein ACLPYS_13815 [Vulcanimicrobiaceae bacterium]